MGPTALECFLLSARRWYDTGIRSTKLSENQCGFVVVGGIEYWYSIQLSTGTGDVVPFPQNHGPDYFLCGEE